MEIVFWTLLGFILYTYLGYPLIIYTWSIFHTKAVAKKDTGSYPRVSVIIAARDEEKNIEKRIRNIVDQDYPEEKLELIIVSDGSRDKTNEIVERLIEDVNDRTVGSINSLQLNSSSHSHGKPSAINKGVSSATGEIIVFTDCRQRFSNDAIKNLVNNFFDKHVGCVSGELFFEETVGSSIQAEMGAYWGFEKWIRKLESKTGSVPGATGAIYATRKNLFYPLPEQTLLDDVLIPLRISMQGYRTVFDSEAIAYDTVSKDLLLEKKRKIRTLAGNWQLLILEPALLNPLKNPLWIRFLSHKIFRLLIPYCLIILLAVALLLQNVYSILFLIVFLLFFIIASLPSFSGHFKIMTKLAQAFRSIIFLNYFALLAPFKLVLNPKKLW